MWPQPGGQKSPPKFLYIQSSRFRQTKNLGPLHLAQTDAENSVAVEESEHNTDVTPERLEAGNKLNSVNMRQGGTWSPRGREQNKFVRHLANKMIKHARDIKYANEHEMWCPDCRLFPVMPVTGACGHTRCSMCIRANGRCPCGAQPPVVLHLNVLVQDLLNKMLPSQAPKTVATQPCSSTPTTSSGGPWEKSLGPERLRRQTRLLHYNSTQVVVNTPVPFQQPLAAESRYKYARDLLAAGKYREAAPHFAHAAATDDPVAKSAKELLAQSITFMARDRDMRRLCREMYRAVREHAFIAWLKPADVECIICYQIMKCPVTTPCGHTFCRACIDRLLEYSMRCALCTRSLRHFLVDQTADTAFVNVVLATVNSQIPASDFLPIFACTVAFPAIPCPLLIFDPRYWVMIKRVLDSGSRKFGMVYERDGSLSGYGTMLEVRDCVMFEDGRSILSTIGVSRFKVIERVVREGFNMARVEPLADVAPNNSIALLDLRLLASQIGVKAMIWLSTLNVHVVNDIESAFGKVPRFVKNTSTWWESPDGPDWMWWLVAILPLRSEIQVLILSTTNLMKRMMAVSRTLDVMKKCLISPVLSGCQLPSDIYLFYDTDQN